MSLVGAVDRLRRTLAHTWRFSILCVITPPGAAREWLLDELATWAKVGVIAPLRPLRPPPGESLWGLMQQGLAQHTPGEGFVLTDLEPYLQGENVAPGLLELNLFRNLLRESLAGPLVFVVSERVAASLARALPDLYSWRAATCEIGDEDVAAWRRESQRRHMDETPLKPQRSGVASMTMKRKRWVPSERRTDHVYVVAAEYANDDHYAPRAVMKPHRYRRTSETPPLTALMETASANALRELPDPACVTHLHGITMPDRRFATDELNAFYGFKPALKLGDRCAMRMEVGTSNGGAVALASAWELLRGAREPGTALVLAGQSFEANTNPREFVAEVIDRHERRLGLNMIPVGDLAMDALVHLAGSASRVRNALGDPARAEEFLARWCEVKLRLAAEYHPSQRSLGRDSVGNDLQARWLRTSHIAQASVGACAVVLTTDAKVVEYTLRRVDAPAARVVRIVGVGEGDAPISVRERDEPIVFFRAFRQAFSNLRRATGRSIDHLRAASFAVLHDAFPSIELAALVALGLSPLDIEQRTLSYWTNPYGGLVGMGHAFAASGLVQVAKAYHTMLRPQRFFRSSVEGSHHPEFHNAPGSLHALTLSVGGPMSNAVAMLVESVVPESAAARSPSTRRAPDEAESPAWDAAAVLPPRHRLATMAHVPFEDKILRVASLGRAYAQGLHDAAGRDLTDGRWYGVLEARTLLRLDSILTSMLPLFGSVDDWCTPATVAWAGTAVPLGALKAELARVLSAPWSDRDGDGGLRKHLITRVEVAAKAAIEGLGIDPAVREREAAALAMHLRVILSVPMGYALVGEVVGGAPIHQLCVLGGLDSPDAFKIGDLLEVTAGVMPHARPSKRRYPGLVPPWVVCVEAEGRFTGSAATMVALTGAQEAIDASEPHDGLGLLYEAARLAIGDVVASPKRAPPTALSTLLRELVLNPDEDWDRLRSCLHALRREPESLPRGRITMHCVFDLLDARRVGDLAELRRRLDAVNLSIRRAEAWLEGTTATHARHGDLFAVSAMVPGESWAQRWFPALSFARSVYQECLERGEKVRAVLALGEGVPVHSIDGTGAAPVSRMAFAVDSVNERASSRAFSTWFHGDARDGVVVVLDAAMARDVADELAGGSTDDPEPAFQALWALVGGEKLSRIDARRGEGRAAYGTIPGDGSMPTTYYELRARGQPEQAGPIQASPVIDNPIAAARALLAELYPHERSIRRLATTHGFAQVLSRVDLRGAPTEVWADLIDLIRLGAVDSHEGNDAVAWLLEGASVEFPANRRIAALIRLLRGQAPPARPSTPPSRA